MSLTLIKISDHFNHVVVQVHCTHFQYLILAIGNVEQQTCQIQWIILSLTLLTQVLWSWNQLSIIYLYAK